MNTLTQYKSSLIGSQEALFNLENKTGARLLVLSDSHGQYDTVSEIIMHFGIDCDALVFAGDGVRDILTCVEIAQTDENLRNALPPVIAFVRGNGDTDTYKMKNMDDEARSFPVHLESKLIFKAAGRNVLVVHGQNHGVDFGSGVLASTASVYDTDIVFFGHTHRPVREESGGTLIVNPGSCSRPRGGFPPSFSVVSFPGFTERYTVEFFTLTEKIFGGCQFKLLELS